MKGKEPCRPFPFMELPLDLRLIVYECVLGSWSDIIELQQVRHYSHQCVNSKSPLSQSSRDLKLLRTCRQIYFEAANLVFKRPVQFWTQQETIFENALGESVGYFGDLESKPRCNTASMKINALLDAAWRSRLEVIHLQFEYLHHPSISLPEPRGRQPSCETRAEHIFLAFPSLKTLKITTYGSKSHYILTEADNVEVASLKDRLSRLVGSIPKHVKVILSGDCPKSEVIVLDPERARCLVQEAWNCRPEIRNPFTWNIHLAALAISDILSFC